jgi:hypothetical protein
VILMTRYRLSREEFMFVVMNFLLQLEQGTEQISFVAEPDLQADPGASQFVPQGSASWVNSTLLFFMLHCCNF